MIILHFATLQNLLVSSNSFCVESLGFSIYIAQQVKNLPAKQETEETWVQSLGSKDPLE